jgi:UDP-glucose 6-dehydrogenase
MKQKIIIIGMGNIGSHVKDELLRAGTPDKPSGLILHYQDPRIGYDEYQDDIIYDFGIICLPTDSQIKDSKTDTTFIYPRADISIIKDVISKVKNIRCWVIRSAIPPQTCEHLESLNSGVPFIPIIYMPEFWGTTLHSKRTINHIIMGYSPMGKPHAMILSDIYAKAIGPDLHIRYTNHRTAELVKYMENCFLALKVSFCAEFYTLADQIGVDYPELRECFTMDDRVGDTHTFINPFKPYYESHCLDKDIPAIIHYANTVGVDMAILNTMYEQNELAKHHHNQTYKE